MVWKLHMCPRCGIYLGDLNSLWEYHRWVILWCNRIALFGQLRVHKMEHWVSSLILNRFKTVRRMTFLVSWRVMQVCWRCYSVFVVSWVGPWELCRNRNGKEMFLFFWRCFGIVRNENYFYNSFFTYSHLHCKSYWSAQIFTVYIFCFSCCFLMMLTFSISYRH